MRRDLRTSATGRKPTASNSAVQEANDSGPEAERQFDLPAGLGRGVDLGTFVGDVVRIALAAQPQGLVRLGEIPRRMGEVKIDLLLGGRDGNGPVGQFLGERQEIGHGEFEFDFVGHGFSAEEWLTER